MPISAEHWEARIGRRVRLRDLHVLLTVVQTSSMAKAAQRLSISQSAVSKAIADLEYTVGVRLLDRSPRGVEPTSYGSALVKRGLAAFDELRQGVGEIEFMSDASVGEVRVGCPESMVATLLPPVVKQLSAGRPGITVQVAQMNPITLDVRELRERRVDMMIGRVAPAFAEEDLKTEVLFEERLVVVAGAQSHWARRRNVDLSKLLDASWIHFPPGEAPRMLVDKAFAAKGLTAPRAAVATFSFYLRDMLLTSGDYVTVIPASMVRVFNAKGRAVKVLPIDLGIQARPVAIFTLKNRTLSPAAELFIKCVRATVKSSLSNLGVPE
jgi:DNA-binding transcriptional LysR family regulator